MSANGNKMRFSAMRRFGLAGGIAFAMAFVFSFSFFVQGALAQQATQGQATKAAVLPPALASGFSGGLLEPQATLSDDGYSLEEDEFIVSGLESGKIVRNIAWGDSTFYLTVNDGFAQGAATVTSSNTNVATVDPAKVNDEDNAWHHPIILKHASCGVSKITVKYGARTISFPVIVYAYGASVTSVTKASYSHAKVSWGKVNGVSGYIVKSAPSDEYGGVEGDLKVVATVKGDASTSASVKVPWNKYRVYSVIPFVEQGGERYCVESGPVSEAFALPIATVKLKPVKKSGSKNLKLNWVADAGAASFDVYRSVNENYGFKKVATTKTKSYVDKKVTKNVTYYYRISASYPGYGAAKSNSDGAILLSNMKALKKTYKKIKQNNGYGSYSWNWARPDDVFYFKRGSRLYAVSHYGKRLYVYGFSKSMKLVSAKVVKLPKHDVWGGFYHGADGYNYVALGNHNAKESKSKPVIKVVKYSANWKKGKTAVVKGGASNAFDGIYEPFDAGTVSFDLRGRTLYVITARTMFQGSDGLRHQSNIAFSINTKTMEAIEDNVDYTSHSFNQRVRFKDGSIYLANHGDAYSRGICLTVADGYVPAASAAISKGTPSYTSSAYVPFAFKGDVGDNYTGATMGGMEVGASNVMICGTSQPHGQKVMGVSGFKSGFKENVYVTVTDRKTGKTSIKWLTKMNPKKSAYTVGETRMVKISDNRFGVLYSVTNDKTNASKVCYAALDNTGKKLLSKTYKNMRFTGSSQPIFFNGAICWMEKGSNSKSVFYRIPA